MDKRRFRVDLVNAENMFALEDYLNIKVTDDPDLKIPELEGSRLISVVPGKGGYWIVWDVSAYNERGSL